MNEQHSMAAGRPKRTPAKPGFTTPERGGSFSVVISDIRESIRLAPVWLYSGWIDVLWKYRRTKLGAFWHTLALGAFVFVMGTIWAVVLKQDPTHHFRYVGTSLIVWSLLSYFVVEGTHCILSSGATALSIRFPFIAFAMGHVWRALLLFGHHCLLYLIIMVVTQFLPGWIALLALPALLLLVANGVWISLLVGIICMRSRDVVPAAASAMQIAMFVTPILWPKDMLGPELAYAVDYNPLYHLVRIVRDPLIGQMPDPVSWIWAVGTLIVGTAVTFWIYGRVRDRIAFWY
ncbi:ABC transporter permease [Marivibrio halodurans]|uniref:ABC transporter permease n=1 Tax=Marivibrio halodurans TaxID=2039722 RepID=A0A8J7V198_9PROT|nr:ABC transporter permease [Marivibrio halodurans]MBP5855612.1 ABC transporter permease [Marivibrio halodurans]